MRTEHGCNLEKGTPARSDWISTALFFVPLIAVASGCGPSLRGPDGQRVSLKGYDAVRIKRITLAPELDYPGLPAQLAMHLEGRLQLSENWVSSRTHGWQFGSVSSTAAGDLDLCLTVLRVSFASRGERVWFAAPHSMRCRIEVYKHEGVQLLGVAEVAVSVDPGGGTGLDLTGGPAGYLLGVLARSRTDQDELHKIMLYNKMAGEIVAVMDRAKKTRRNPRDDSKLAGNLSAVWSKREGCPS